MGPGVTPGNVNVLSTFKALCDNIPGSSSLSKLVSSYSVNAVSKFVADMPEGDILLVSPIQSGGIAADA